MHNATAIRQAFDQVSALRARTGAHPAQAVATYQVKALQARRFAGSYADLLAAGPFAPAARFFMTELYSPRDYRERDAQFARIAGAIDRLFPARVGAVCLGLAQLHALTEQLDCAMGEAWQLTDAGDHNATRYLHAWRTVGRLQDRFNQLDTVLGIGRELAQLTQTRGLRTLLRLMRQPASAAGLSALQTFLEAGFDTCAARASAPGGAAAFLNLIAQREQALLDTLFQPDLVASETQLRLVLGLAP
ncbi:MAG: hypothetical protein RLZZ401_975 [Pseudomonadota bacterium]